MTNEKEPLVASEEIWEPGQHYTCQEYKTALSEVFRSVYFMDATTRFNVFGSYKMALRSIVSYALANNIDEIEHIKSIRDILLQSPKCVERKEPKSDDKNVCLSVKETRCNTKGLSKPAIRDIVREKFKRFNHKRNALSYNGKVL